MLVTLPNAKEIKLRIIPMHDLIPHEQTIQLLLDSVKRDIQRTGFQRDPIVVDKSTNLVLDGMHRRAALESLSASFALGVCFDYRDNQIILERWLRYFIAPDHRMLEELIDLFSFQQAENYQTAMKLVDSLKSPIALLSKKYSYLSSEKYDLQTVYQRLSEFDRIATESNIQVEFHAENESHNLFLSESVFVLYPMPVTKEDVIRAGRDHKLLPYKTTRHIVPIRPMGLYYPLDLLKQENIDICKTKLKELVSTSQVELIEPNSWYEGRKYSEALALFKRDMNSQENSSTKCE
jgi:hypothetical protein